MSPRDMDDRTTGARPIGRTVARLALGAGAITAATVLGTAGPAAAAPTTPHQAARSGGHTSENWSGYSQTSRQLGRPVTAVGGSWKVPNASQQVRGRSEAVSDWIGIGGGRTAGVTDPTLVQAGVTTTLGHSGYADHYTWIETLPGDAVTTPLQARGGDRLAVAISRAGVDRWRVRLDNRSTGHHWTTTLRYHSAMRSGSWVSERPLIGGTETHLPRRSALTYSQATVNGRATHFRPDQRITMTDNGRRVANPTAAEGNGSSFSVCSYSTRC